MNLNKHFCNYEQSLALKEVGFLDECLACYTITNTKEGKEYNFRFMHQTTSVRGLRAPLISQAFSFLLEKYGLFAETHLFGDGIGYISYIKQIKQEEFKEVYNLGMATPNRGLPNWDKDKENIVCLNKMIEICSQHQNI